MLVGGTKDEMGSYLAPEDKVWERTLTEDELRARVTAGDGKRAYVSNALYTPWDDLVLVGPSRLMQNETGC